MSTKNPGVYNLTRTIRAILKRYRKEAPSLEMHLYYADCIREQKMPNDILDVLDESDVKFFDGCLIVEVHDHRGIEQGDQPSTNDDPSLSQNSPHPNSSAIAQLNRSKKDNHHRDPPQDLPNDQVTLHRCVLTPTCETLWKDLQFMNEAKISQLAGIAKEIKGSQYKWGPMTEEEAVIVESAILERITPPLCLSPSIITTRIANQLLCDTAIQPSTHQKRPRKRPLNSGEEEAMRRKRDRQEKYMHIADESYGQAFAPTFSRVDLIKRMRNTSFQLNKAQEDVSASQQPDQDHSPLPNLPPNGANPDQRMAQSSSADPKQVATAEAYTPLQGPNAAQQSVHHLQFPNPAAQPAAMSPPSIPPPVACASIPTKKTAGGKKKGPANKNKLEDGVSEAGSPAAVLAPTKKLSKKALARLTMTPEELAADDEKKKQRAEARRLTKERRLAAAAAQNLNNPQAGPSATITQSNSTLLAGQDGNISVPGANAGIGHPQGHQDGIPGMQNPSNPTMLSNSNTSMLPHNHSIPVPSLNSNNNSIPVPMSKPDHSIHVPSNDSNMQIDVNHSIPVFSTNHDIAVGQVNHGRQAHSNGIPVPSAQDNSIGIPGGWPSINISGNHNGFQAGYQHGHHPHNLQRDPHPTASNNNGNEMDIHVQQQPPPPQFTPNPTGYKNNLNPW
ncbi:Spt20 family-domain-containing protein [Melampsora americana]|nr:Spt20 family-domain-containing protein [Melampsora americana]